MKELCYVREFLHTGRGWYSPCSPRRILKKNDQTAFQGLGENFTRLLLQGVLLQLCL